MPANDQAGAGTGSAAGASGSAGSGGDTAPVLDWQVCVPGVPAAVGAVRWIVRDAFGESPRADEAELVVSELVTNAIRHTPSGEPGAVVNLRITIRAGWARVEVGDLGDPDWDRPALPAQDEECGRGLAIVHALADKVGHAPVEGGQVSWAEFGWDHQDGTGDPGSPPDARHTRRTSPQPTKRHDR